MAGVSGANEGHPSSAARGSGLRRSQRVCLNIDVEIILQKGKEKGFAEQTKTLIVSAHGALIVLQEPVATGDLLKLRNVRTNEEIGCRVVEVNPGNSGIPEVALEFVKPKGDFWHIAFPPTDWSPRGPESKVYGPQVVSVGTRKSKP
ncbi:MAG: PilZ domain-containing protein [Candidatus Acidiferrum sp.]